MAQKQLNQPATWAAVLATAGITFRIVEMPYGYYMLLRLVLCTISVFLLLGPGLRLEGWHRWALGALAVLYNPVFPVRIGEKSVWIVLNLATVALFWVVQLARLESDACSTCRFAWSGCEGCHGGPNPVRVWRQFERASRDAGSLR
jgi:hypothetical protein